jgi:2-dehydropantoate 2-reductase
MELSQSSTVTMASKPILFCTLSHGSNVQDGCDAARPPNTRAFCHNLMREVVTVGRAKGVPISPDFAATRLGLANLLPPTFKASMRHGPERRNRFELDWLVGYVVQVGGKLGVATPAKELLYGVLKL